MIITRDFTTSIGITDVNVMYSADPKQAIRGLLQQIYAGKCFKQCRILEVTDIVDMGEMACETNRNGGDMIVSIKFRVRAVVYDRYEVIPDMQIVEILEGGRIILQNADAAVMIVADARLAKYEKGQIVPICIAVTKYPPMQPKIVASGLPFIPHRSPPKEWEVDVSAEDRRDARRALADAALVVPDKAWTKFLDPAREPRLEGFQLMAIDEIEGPGVVARPDWMPVGDRRVFWRDMKHEQKIKGSGTILSGYIHDMRRASDTTAALAKQYDLKSKDPWMQVYSEAAR